MVFIISVLFTRGNPDYSYVMRLIHYILRIGIPAEPTIDQSTMANALFQFYKQKHPLNPGLEDSEEVIATFSSEDDGDATENLQKLVNSLKEKVRRRDRELLRLRTEQQMPLDERFQAMVYEAGQLYTLSDKNREMLSARSDILLANLRSIGCSAAKLPEIMENVLAVFLGPISAAVKDAIIPASRTIDRALSRANATHEACNRLQMDNNVSAVCLETDESNKKNSDQTPLHRTRKTQADATLVQDTLLWDIKVMIRLLHDSHVAQLNVLVTHPALTSGQLHLSPSRWHQQIHSPPTLVLWC